MTDAAEGPGLAAPRPGRGGPQRIPRPSDVAPGRPAPWHDVDAALRRPSVDDVRRVLATAGPAEPSPVERDGWDAARLPGEVRRLLRVAADPGRPAAVLAPLYERDGEAWVVLTRRSMALRAHAGEVSFPGGRSEPDDPDLVATALREAEEEVGLPPRAVEVIGELDHLATVSSGSFIVPWVGALREVPTFRPCSREVDAVLEVPLSELMEPGVFREEMWSFAGTRRPIVFFDIVGDTIWGATAAMLRQLLGLVTGTVGRGELDHD